MSVNFQCDIDNTLQLSEVIRSLVVMEFLLNSLVGRKKKKLLSERKTVVQTSFIHGLLVVSKLTVVWYWV